MASKRQPRRRPARPGSRRCKPARDGAEGRLLALARELGSLARREPPDRVLGVAVLALGDAYAPSAPLPRDLARAWERAREDEAAALSLAWAREQVRLALAEILARAWSPPGPAGAEARAGISARAWVWLAACEALAREAPDAGVERLRQVLELTGPVARPR